MTDNLSGYQTGVSYPATLERKLTPGWMAAMSRLYGVAAPEPSNPFHMLDVGCGVAFGLALTAASHPNATFEGIDGMSAHIAEGTAFASDIPNITLAHRTFDHALTDGGPACDFVIIHGVLSWVAPEIREQALDIAASRLAPGGLLGVSYNALPGRVGMLSYQHLVKALAETGSGEPSTRYLAAHARVKELMARGFKALSAEAISDFEEKSDKIDSAYFPHEFLNAHWQPLWGSEVQAGMQERGLSFVGQNSLLSLRPELTVPKRIREIIEAEQDPVRRDTLFDMAMNTPFRVDLYAKDPVPAVREDVARICLAATTDADAELAIGTPAGVLRYDNPAARGILTALQDGPMTLSALSTKLALGLQDMIKAGTCLVIGDHAVFCTPPGDGVLANRVNKRLSAAALCPEKPPLGALAGACGPIAASPAMIGLVHGTTEQVVAAAKASPVLFDRFFDEEADLAQPDALSKAAAAHRVVLSHLARLGVPMPDL